MTDAATTVGAVAPEEEAGVRSQGTAGFDEQPPVPVDDYDATARGMNPGYELVFALTAALLRAHSPAEARLLLVGAGGSTEVRAIGAAGPHWRLTAVDPSADMLALARGAAQAASLADRVRLLRGTLDDLASGESGSTRPRPSSS